MAEKPRGGCLSHAVKDLPCFYLCRSKLLLKLLHNLRVFLLRDRNLEEEGEERAHNNGQRHIESSRVERLNVLRGEAIRTSAT